MIYQNPFHVLQYLGVDDLDVASLKKTRQQLFLRFDLNDSNTISIRSKEFDKATIIELFEDLKINGVNHRKVYQNKSLLDLLENGDLFFFDKSTSWNIFNDLSFSVWVRPYFVHSVQREIMNLVLSKQSTSILELSNLKLSLFKYPGSSKSLVYSEVFNYYNKWVSEVRSQVVSPLKYRHGKIELKSKVIDSFKPEILLKMQALPESIFNPILVDYAEVSRELLNQACYKRGSYDDFEINTLHVINQAGKVYLSINPHDLNVKKFIEGATRYLSVDHEKEESTAIVWICIIMIVVFLVSLKIR